MSSLGVTGARGTDTRGSTMHAQHVSFFVPLKLRCVGIPTPSYRRRNRCPSKGHMERQKLEALGGSPGLLVVNDGGVVTAQSL